MDDLTITRLCAEAMGLRVQEHNGWLHVLGGGYTYNPLDQDEQAYALMRTLMLNVDAFAGVVERGYGEEKFTTYVDDGDSNSGSNLNRAICECVAKMQAEGSKGVSGGTPSKT